MTDGGRSALLDRLTTIAKETLIAWDSDRDSRVGKMLSALAGLSRGYRADIDELRDALAGFPVNVGEIAPPAPPWQQEYRDALAGIVGLIQLLPDEQRRPLLENHRYVTAYLLLAQIDGTPAPPQAPKQK